MSFSTSSKPVPVKKEKLKAPKVDKVTTKAVERAAKLATKEAAKAAKIAEKLAIQKKKELKAPRAASNFINFANEHRAGVKEKDPTLTFGGVGKKLGEMWRELSEQEKAKYVSKK